MGSEIFDAFFVVTAEDDPRFGGSGKKIGVKLGLGFFEKRSGDDLFGTTKGEVVKSGKKGFASFGNIIKGKDGQTVDIERKTLENNWLGFGLI